MMNRSSTQLQAVRYRTDNTLDQSDRDFFLLICVLATNCEVYNVCFSPGRATGLSAVVRFVQNV
jgi:hypothetical protein